jgi:ribonucleoside-diphosphate reductase alpha chain
MQSEEFAVIRRNGKLSNFDPNKIAAAMRKTFLAVEGESADLSDRIHQIVNSLTTQVVEGISRHLHEEGTVQIEQIQDQVELALMRGGYHKIARAYVLYREEHANLRANQPEKTVIHVKAENGQSYPLDEARLRALVTEACANLEDVNPEFILEESLKNLFDGINEGDINHTLLMSTRSWIEKEPNYSYVAARLLLEKLRTETFKFLSINKSSYKDYFKVYINRAIKHELLDPRLAEFDLEKLANTLVTERDLQFSFLGLQTLYDRYFLHWDQARFELPQAFFMRVAMGLSLNESDPNERAIEFYNLLSKFDFMSSTPTLFNSGTLRSQMSSCYLSTVPDDLDGIFNAIKDNALLSKFAGGLGNDWTSVRGMGAHIKGTNGKSQGVVPFLKVVNDTLVAVNQGGRRRGSGCAYLETWHIDINEFLELRKNTGDERRRAHDMNSSNWIPDEFMIRVHENKQWTLFSPDEVPDLHELYGEDFKAAYEKYETAADEGKIKIWQRINAVDLWRKMLTMLFETGHPWFCFKDPCNIRSPQQHVGVVHSSNLCCIAADQRVISDRGLLTIGELYKLGGKNKVVGLDGVYDASEMLLPRPNAPMVQIETQEGYTHKVTPDHKVWVKDKGWVEAQNLIEDDKLLIQQLEGLWGHKHNPKLSYLMGLIAGDGTFGKHQVFIDIWEQDFDFIEGITEKVHYLLDGNTVLKTTSTNTPEFSINDKHKRARLSSAPLYRLLKKHGFTAENKTQVPELIWQGSRETVAEYLRGLYQADGHVQTGKGITTLVLASKDLKFIKELQILWANFGVKTSINKMRDHQLQPLYRLLITSIQGCKIAEEIINLAATKNSEAARQYLENIKKQGYKQKLYAKFKGLTKLANEDAYCLMVNSETHAWTVNGFITKNTEITLNTKANEEVSVCNLGSVNLAAHIKNGQLDNDKLQSTISTAMRMLDNVIDLNYYPIESARTSNLRHRPVGLGLMGFQDALYQLRIPYASKKAIEFADQTQEFISYYAISASSDLAAERGSYSSFEGSLWSQGILPIDSIKNLATARGKYLEISTTSSLDWDSLRERVKKVGMRNSNTMAIAPTATISNISGVTQSIEPTYQNLYVKSNLSGEFTIINPYLVQDLKQIGLWDEVMINDLKFCDGRINAIERIPAEIKNLYATSFEIDTTWLIEAASRRQKWIDQAQSLNLYILEPSGRKLDQLYKLAWLRGLKTTYYLRTMGATHVEKNTIRTDTSAPQVCGLDDEECESCQ